MTMLSTCPRKLGWYAFASFPSSTTFLSLLSHCSPFSECSALSQTRWAWSLLNFTAIIITRKYFWHTLAIPSSTPFIALFTLLFQFCTTHHAQQHSQTRPCVIPYLPLPFLSDFHSPNFSSLFPIIALFLLYSAQHSPSSALGGTSDRGEGGLEIVKICAWRVVRICAWQFSSVIVCHLRHCTTTLFHTPAM